MQLLDAHIWTEKQTMEEMKWALVADVRRRERERESGTRVRVYERGIRHVTDIVYTLEVEFMNVL